MSLAQNSTEALTAYIDNQHATITGVVQEMFLSEPDEWYMRGRDSIAKAGLAQSRAIEAAEAIRLRGDCDLDFQAEGVPYLFNEDFHPAESGPREGE